MARLTGWYKAGDGSLRIDPRPNGCVGFVRKTDRWSPLTGRGMWAYGHRLDGEEVVLGLRDYQNEAKVAVGLMRIRYSDDEIRAFEPHSDPGRTEG